MKKAFLNLSDINPYKMEVLWLSENILTSRELDENFELGVLILGGEYEVIFLNSRGVSLLEIQEDVQIDEAISEFIKLLDFDGITIHQNQGKKSKISMNGNSFIIDLMKWSNADFHGYIVLFNTIDIYKRFNNILEDQHKASSLLYTILDATDDCIVYVNKDGIIEMLSRAYAEFLKIDRKAAIGRHVSEIIENTRMDEVIRIGKPEMAQLQEINGRKMIANRIPVFAGGKITGAVGRVLFRDLKDLNKLYAEIHQIEKELNMYRDEFNKVNKAKFALNSIIGESSAMRELKSTIQRVAVSSSSILILGDSGTGKELFAQAIHNNSQRRGAPFIKVNCGAIPNELLESELFGYEEGAFTGAKKGGKIGKFKAADGGTIFLDEIGELPPNMQVKLLRVLQEREVERIGSMTSEKIDVRVIAATNKNLEKMVDEGQFRLDLFYRLNVVILKIPPLCERKDDIPLIAESLIRKIADQQQVIVDGISSKAMEFLKRYDWPGNVRELENVLERAVNFMDNETKIMTKHLPSKITGMSGFEAVRSLKETMDKVEKEILVNSLILYRGNKTEIAEALGISRTSLYEKMAKHGIDKQNDC